ncbi:MAG: arsenate reductase ArsC [Planctomycetota bacterium]
MLILCTGNIARSQMAEAWWRYESGGRWDVFSAGIHPGKAVHPLAVRVMAEAGLDIREQRPKSVADFVHEPFDLVVTVCAAAEQACPLFPTPARRESWPVDDPAIAGNDPQRQLAVFRRLRDELRQLIRAFLETEQC